MQVPSHVGLLPRGFDSLRFSNAKFIMEVEVGILHVDTLSLLFQSRTDAYVYCSAVRSRKKSRRSVPVVESLGTNRVFWRVEVIKPMFRETGYL